MFLGVMMSLNDREAGKILPGSTTWSGRPGGRSVSMEGRVKGDELEKPEAERV